jgi:hypothetical protein
MRIFVDPTAAIAGDLQPVSKPAVNSLAHESRYGIKAVTEGMIIHASITVSPTFFADDIVTD